jgi:hypothetical protein
MIYDLISRIQVDQVAGRAVAAMREDGSHAER